MAALRPFFTSWKVRIRSSYGPYFPSFGLNTASYVVFSYLPLGYPFFPIVNAITANVLNRYAWFNTWHIFWVTLKQGVPYRCTYWCTLKIYIPEQITVKIIKDRWLNSTHIRILSYLFFCTNHFRIYVNWMKFCVDLILLQS